MKQYDVGNFGSFYFNGGVIPGCWFSFHSKDGSTDYIYAFIDRATDNVIRKSAAL